MNDQSPPAGWHPDPSGSDQYRYWDGQQWTEHYSPKPATPPIHASVDSKELAKSAKQYKKDHGGPSTFDRLDPTSKENFPKVVDWAKRNPVLATLAGLGLAMVVIINVFFPQMLEQSPSETPKVANGSIGPDGRRVMTGTWKVNIDPERSIKLKLDGSFKVSQDKAEAKAGETDINVETFGSITATNVSDGRNVRGIDTGLQLFVPIKFCPDWADLDPTGSHCSRDLVSFDIPDLDVGESDTFGISDSQRVASVRVADAKKVIGGMLGKSAVVVSADRVFANEYLEKLNPSCTFNKDTVWVTYYTEDKKVTACSTEVRR